MLTPPDAFVKATALVLDALIDEILADTPHFLTEPQIEWFQDYCDIRFRWLHANKRSWRKWLENQDRRIDPRGQSLVWIRHWFAAYTKHPARFQRQETCCPACGDAAEWTENRSDGFVWWECDACGHKSGMERVAATA